jgi:PAS domain-containing protein
MSVATALARARVRSSSTISRARARDAAAKPVRISGTHLDITERKSMETSLHQALRQSETLLETTPTAIAVIRDRVILRCNPAMERLFGAHPGELLGRSTRVLFPSDADWEATGKQVYEPIARGETPVGIVYETDAKIEPKVKTIGTFPDSSYPPVTYPVAATSSTKKPVVGQYLNFLRSPAAKAVFERYGFSYLIKPVS